MHTYTHTHVRVLEVMVVGNDGESDCRIPAGWSAAGQPNDAIHQFWHALRKARERVAIGCQSELVATCKRVQVHAHIHTCSRVHLRVSNRRRL